MIDQLHQEQQILEFLKKDTGYDPITEMDYIRQLFNDESYAIHLAYFVLDLIESSNDNE